MKQTVLADIREQHPQRSVRCATCGFWGTAAELVQREYGLVCPSCKFIGGLYLDRAPQPAPQTDR